MIDEQNSKLLVFFSALSDANRLKIVGLLAQREYSVEELAEMLKLRASTVSHHLSRLSKVGLVSAHAESYYNVYSLNTGVLETMAKTIMAEDTLPQLAADVDMDAYDRKVINDYLGPDGRLKTIPAQRKKRDAVLRFLAQSFDLSSRYTEMEVNDILRNFHDDTATLRRELIGSALLARKNDGSEYWVVE